MDIKKLIPFVSEHITLWDVLGSLREMRDTNADALYIASAGGDCGHFPEICHEIMSRPFATIAGSLVGSFALDVLLCGTHRYATPDAVFLPHRLQLEGHDLSYWQMVRARVLLTNEPYSNSMTKLNELIAHAEIEEGWYAHWMAQRTHLSIDGAMRMMRDGEQLTTSEAMYYGIIDKVIEPETLKKQFAQACKLEHLL